MKRNVGHHRARALDCRGRAAPITSAPPFAFISVGQWGKKWRQMHSCTNATGKIPKWLKVTTLSKHLLNKNIKYRTSLVVKDSACQCRGHEFHPWSGKIPQAAEPLTLWAPRLLKPVHLEPVLCNQRSHSSEQPVRPTIRESLGSNQDPAQQKVKQKTSDYKAAEFFKKTLNWAEMERKAFIFHSSEKLTHIS